MEEKKRGGNMLNHLSKKIISIVVLALIFIFPKAVYAVDDYTDIWNYFLNSSGIYEANSIRPDDSVEFSIFVGDPIYTHMYSSYNNTYSLLITNCSSDYSSCDFKLSKSGTEVDSRNISITYKSLDSSIIDKYENYASEMDSTSTTVYVPEVGANTSFHVFNYKDLELYNKNSLAASIGNYNAINHFDEIDNLYNDPSLSFHYIARAGDIQDFYGFNKGTLNYLYNGTIVSTANVAFLESNVIYIPKDTENTSEAYISAAKKRIKDNLGIDADIEVGGTRSTYSFVPYGDFSTADELFASFGTEEELGDYWYNAKFDSFIQKYLIVANIETTENTVNNNTSDDISNSINSTSDSADNNSSDNELSSISTNNDSTNTSTASNSIISNPQTVDNIFLNILTFIISIFGLVLFFINKKKQRKIKI